MTEPEAMDGVVTGPLQQIKRDPHKATELYIMEEVKQGPLHASKRKYELVLENPTVKKHKMSPSTTPPVRKLQADGNTKSPARTTSFFARNQKPGYTAAIPTVSTSYNVVLC